MIANSRIDLNNIPPPVFSVTEELERKPNEWFDDFMPNDFLKYDSGFSLTFDQQLSIWPFMVLIGDLDDLDCVRMSCALNEYFFPLTKFYRFLSDPSKLFIQRQIFPNGGGDPVKEEFFIKDISYIDFYIYDLVYTCSENEYQMRHRKFKIQELIRVL